MNTTIWNVTALLVSSCLLAVACGGSGGSTNDDTTPPTIESMTPAHDTEAVSVATKVWVEFSEAMDADATEAAFSLESELGAVSGSFTWADNNMVFSPSQDLQQATDYSITVTTDAMDQNGNYLAEETISAFITGSSIGVESVSPADNATEVATDESVVINFAQAMDPSSTEANFTLESDAGVVSGVISWVDHSLTFEPDTHLLSAKLYSVSVGRGAMDTEENHLPEVFSSSFTTVTTIPEISGDIISDLPTWTWSAPDDCTGFRYQLDSEDGAWTEVEATVKSYLVESALPLGEHTLYLQAEYNDADWSESASWLTEAGPVCPGDLVIETAADLVGITCLMVEGDLSVWGSSTLTDLAGLESIKLIGGKLDIQYNSVLTSLHGLEGLVKINGNLSAWGNNVLTSMAGLENLTRIDGSISLNDSSFTSLTGLAKLESIGGNLSLSRGSTSGLTGLDSLTSIEGDIIIMRIAGLADFTGLEQLESIGGTIRLFRSNLDSFAGLTNLKSIGGDLSIEESTAKSFAGLENLAIIHGSLNFSDSYSTPDLSGLSALTTIAGDLIIGMSAAPASLTGLESLVTVAGDLRLNMAGLSDFAGLDGLESIGGTMTLQNNQSLDTLKGLEALVSIAGDLNVSSHMGLTSVSEMTSLATLGGNLAIKNNMVLPTCEAEKVVSQLQANGWAGTADTSGNVEAGTCD